MSTPSESHGRAHDRAVDDDPRPMSVAEIQQWRVQTDSLVFPEKTNGYESMVSESHRERIVAERAERAAEVDGDYIERATWGEVAAYCTAASGVATNISSEFVGIYTLAFQKHVSNIGEQEVLPDDIADRSDRYVDDRVREKAGELRRSIKETQDKAFVEPGGGYDELPIEPEPPKAFWRRQL